MTRSCEMRRLNTTTLTNPASWTTREIIQGSQCHSKCKGEQAHYLWNWFVCSKDKRQKLGLNANSSCQHESSMTCLQEEISGSQIHEDYILGNHDKSCQDMHSRQGSLIGWCNGKDNHNNHKMPNKFRKSFQKKRCQKTPLFRVKFREFKPLFSLSPQKRRTNHGYQNVAPQSSGRSFLSSVY